MSSHRTALVEAVYGLHLPEEHVAGTVRAIIPGSSDVLIIETAPETFCLIARIPSSLAPASRGEAAFTGLPAGYRPDEQYVDKALTPIMHRESILLVAEDALTNRHLMTWRYIVPVLALGTFLGSVARSSPGMSLAEPPPPGNGPSPEAAADIAASGAHPPGAEPPATQPPVPAPAVPTIPAVAAL